VTLGWRSDVHRLMQLADVLVQNAGGLSCTEAMVAGLPSVTYRAIPGHGRANAAVLHDAGLAPWARDRGELAVALHAQLGRDRTPPAVPDPTGQVLAALPADVGRDTPLAGRRAA
jgi:UDP-N-acetylglucosamine:LPS N-acetylglucosamine transferase